MEQHQYQHHHHHAAPLELHQHHHASPLRPPVGVQDQYDQAALHTRPPNPPIKVRLNSNCLECLVKLKKKLQTMSGVNDADVVPEEGGTVTVSGRIDSKTLMEVIRKNYRRATILCPFDQKDELSRGKRKLCSESSDDEHDDKKDEQDDNIAVNNRESDAVPSEPKEEPKTVNCCIMTCFAKMRCFGKRSKPAAKSPTPPPPCPSPVPEPKPPIGKSRPGFRPGLLMPPFPPPPVPYGYIERPPQPPLPYGYLGRPPQPPALPYGYLERPPQPPALPYGYLERPPLPPGYGNPIPKSPPRSNPMIHYTSYTDNYRYP